MNQRILIGIAGLIIAIVIAAASLFTVGQTQQVLITQFGQPIRVIEDAGLHAKIPFVQTSFFFDRRLLDYDMPGEEVILGDQRRLIVDGFARYRITDPLRFYQAVGATEAGVRARLNSIIPSALRRVLGAETLLNVLSNDRARITALIRVQVNEEMRGFGVSVEDVRIRRADLPEENTQAILSRMQSERERVAKQARAEGADASQRIRADAERDRTVLLAQARAEAERLRGEGEHASIAIYAAAYGKDADFYSAWRSLQAYREAFGSGQSRLLLSPDEGFLRYLKLDPSSLGGAPPRQ